MKKLIIKLLPSHIRKKIALKNQHNARYHREKVVTQLPKKFLKKKHMANCRLVLNRHHMLEQIGKRSVVAEMGVNRGEFSELLLQITKPDVLHLIDIWGSNRYHDGLFDEVTNKFREEIKSKNVRVHRNLSTKACDGFPDNYFDMIYIDTDHSYQTTKEELMAYAPKMKQGGIIAGHDYIIGNWVKSHRYGVIEAVHEFCVNNDWELIFLTAEPLECKSFAIRKIWQNNKNNA